MSVASLVSFSHKRWPKKEISLMNPRRRTEDSLMQSARLKKWYVVLKHLPSNFGFKTLCLQKKIPTMKDFPSNSWLKDVDACLNSVQISRIFFKLIEHYFNLSNFEHFGFSRTTAWFWLLIGLEDLWKLSSLLKDGFMVSIRWLVNVPWPKCFELLWAPNMVLGKMLC